MGRLDDIDRRIILATQGGLPLVPRPYHVVAGQAGTTPEEVMHRMERMREEGTIRRIGAVPNHYALGYRANAMAVWDVEDDAIDALGVIIGALPFVSHCYRRVRRPPRWPYNLFVMVHGTNRCEVEDKVRHIAALIGAASRGHAMLYSKRILKKTGVRLK
ncbi:MAG: siroheme decarboxylase subunit beta [Betaproteobacteria bacterium]